MANKYNNNNNETERTASFYDCSPVRATQTRKKDRSCVFVVLKCVKKLGGLLAYTVPDLTVFPCCRHPSGCFPVLSTPVRMFSRVVDTRQSVFPCCQHPSGCFPLLSTPVRMFSRVVDTRQDVSSMYEVVNASIIGNDFISAFWIYTNPSIRIHISAI